MLNIIMMIVTIVIAFFLTFAIGFVVGVMCSKEGVDLYDYNDLGLTDCDCQCDGCTLQDD